jgi:hypothetical protein
VRESGRRVRAGRHDLRAAGLLGELLPLDDHLDVVLLVPPLIVVAPPHWSLIIASQSQILASCAAWGTFVALLSS